MGQGDAENVATGEVETHFIDSVRLSVSTMLAELSSPDIE